MTPVDTRHSMRETAQLERLFDLLPDDLFDVAKQLPYPQRVQVERWFTHEAERLSPVMARVAGGAQHNSPAVIELLDMLAADPIDTQAAGKWLTEHREEITPLLLTELISAAMGRGVMNLMSSRADKRQGENRERKAEALRLWKEEYAEKKMSKENAAPRIAEKVGLKPSTVRRYLRGL